jgi:hypothetical protein
MNTPDDGHVMPPPPSHWVPTVPGPKAFFRNTAAISLQINDLRQKHVSASISRVAPSMGGSDRTVYNNVPLDVNPQFFVEASSGFAHQYQPDNPGR